MKSTLDQISRATTGLPYGAGIGSSTDPEDACKTGYLDGMTMDEAMVKGDNSFIINGLYQSK